MVHVAPCTNTLFDEQDCTHRIGLSLTTSFRYFDTIDLWYREVTLDGETRRLPTTAADIGLAVIYLKDLITGRVVNWSLSDEMTRIVISVGVAYGTDVELAMNLMREAAEEHEHALDDPPPLLSFDSFGDNALTLTLRVYVSAISHRIKTKTDLRRAINHKFNETGITIAYPQLDVHIVPGEKPR